MRGYVRRLLVVGLVAGALGACGSPVMKPVPAVQGVAGGKALVNFVRPRVFFGDGVSFSIWDGDRLVMEARSNINLCQLYVGWCAFW